MLRFSSSAHVLPMVVMATPVMLITTAATLDTLMVSWEMSAPKKSVKRPDVDVNTVVLATLVLAKAEFDKYYKEIQCNTITTQIRHNP